MEQRRRMLYARQPRLEEIERTLRGTMTVSDRLSIMEKIPAFQELGVCPTSPAIVPTFVFTSVNIVSRLSSTHPCSISFINSVILSMIDPMNYENSVESCGITVCATIMIPPPDMSCLIPCDFAPGLSLP